MSSQIRYLYIQILKYHWHATVVIANESQYKIMLTKPMKVPQVIVLLPAS